MELNGFSALWESFVRGNNAKKNHLDIEGFWMNLLRRRLDWSLCLARRMVNIN
jgi:hypothetical protein